MSKAWERAMGALEDQDPATTLERSKRRFKCWRCLRNPSRVDGEDFTCDPCYAYMVGETDEDPRAGAVPVNEYSFSQRWFTQLAEGFYGAGVDTGIDLG